MVSQLVYSIDECSLVLVTNYQQKPGEQDPDSAGGTQDHERTLRAQGPATKIGTCHHHLR